MRAHATFARLALASPRRLALTMLALAPLAARAGEPIYATPLVASVAAHAPPFATPQVRIDTGGPVPAAVQDELDRAVPFPTAILRGTRYHSTSSCRADSAELTTPLQASGRATIRVSGVAPDGAACKGWASVEVSVSAETLVAEQPIREGAPLAGLVRRVRREVKAGETPLLELPQGAVATRSLSAGQRISPAMFKIPGLAPGAMIRVRVESGALALEQPGRVVACDSRAAGVTCALVGQNKKVEGNVQDGVLLVSAESP